MSLEQFLGLVSVACLLIGGILLAAGFRDRRARQIREFENLLRPPPTREEVEDEEFGYKPNATDIAWRQKMVKEQRERDDTYW